MIGIPEIVFIAVILAGTAVYALYMRKASGSQNATLPPPSSQFIKQKKSKEDKKLKRVEEAQGGLEETLTALMNKVQDLEVALRLQPPEQKEEKKQDETQNP
jgi:peptidoglycan hydrolase CwlO-like protein